MTRRVRSMMTGLGSVSDLYVRAQWSGLLDTSGQDDSSVWSLAVSWVLPPMATFSMWLINRTPTWLFEEWRAEETYQGC